MIVSGYLDHTIPSIKNIKLLMVCAIEKITTYTITNLDGISTLYFPTT